MYILVAGALLFSGPDDWRGALSRQPEKGSPFLPGFPVCVKASPKRYVCLHLSCRQIVWSPFVPGPLTPVYLRRVVVADSFIGQFDNHDKDCWRPPVGPSLRLVSDPPVGRTPFFVVFCV